VDEAVRRRIEARLGVDAAKVVEIDEGWDSLVLEVDGERIVRVPRRDEVRESMRVETRLLPKLAPVLPVPVPRFDLVEDSDLFFVAYPKLSGEPLDDPAELLATELGAFLAALHGFPRRLAIRAGLADVDADGWLARQRALIERCGSEVVPLLDDGEQSRAEAMFEGFVARWVPLRTVLVHADLGPAHILHRGSSITGVIDWSDACLGDPALDFAWLLYGTVEAFASALLEAYSRERDPDPGLRERALFYRRLGPWHEVLFGIEQGRSDLIERGLAGIRARMP
jgi:aminoglycoside phosphotransferase (APT) family kinase protein